MTGTEESAGRVPRPAHRTADAYLHEELLQLARQAFATVPRQGWHKQALCSGRTELFFSDQDEVQEQARRLCEQCAVRVDCLGEALRVPELVGLWAGSTEHERQQIRKTLAPRTSVMLDERTSPATEHTTEPASLDASSASAVPSQEDSGAVELPAWVPKVCGLTEKWQKIAEGGSGSGHWLVDDVEIVVRATAQGAVAYARRRKDSAA